MKLGQHEAEADPRPSFGRDRHVANSDSEPMRRRNLHKSVPAQSGLSDRGGDCQNDHWIRHGPKHLAGRSN